MKKNKKNAILQFCSFAALVVSVGFPVFILLSILINSYSALIVTKILLPIEVESSYFSISDPRVLRGESIHLLNNSLSKVFKGINFQENDEILSNNAHKELGSFLYDKPKDADKYEVWLTASSIMNLVNKNRQSSDHYIKLLARLQETGRVGKFFNKSLFSKSDSRDPENAGVLGAFMGSLMVVLVCLVLAVPIGIISGVFIHEFMPSGAFITNIVEISINNLASVPSIIFGVVGFTLYIVILGLPRSSPIVGGMTLSLMMLPNIIIATKDALSNVPTSIKDAAFALGTPLIKVILNHSLPIALPRIVHGAVLAVARILGESSPLLMVGMVAFVADVPKSVFDPATVLPVQIYIWSSSPEVEFVELAAIAIIVLLFMLFALNLVANFVKKRFDFLTFYS